MENSDILLLRKFIENTCTQQELAQVEQLIQKGIPKEVWTGLMNETEDASDGIFLSQDHKRNLYAGIGEKIEKLEYKTTTLPDRRWLLSGIAAAVLLVVVAYAWLFVGNTEAPAVSLSTTTGGQNVTVGDGSQIWVNNHSTLSYPQEFKDDKRAVELEGEAFFNVTRDTSRPFIITTQNITVRVLGTSFNVKSYPEDEEIVVTLATGKVRVEANGTELDIKPGEQLRYHKQSGNFTTVAANPDDASAWREGWLVFNSITLAEIATTLERWYGVQVIIEDEALKKMKVTLKRKDETLLNVLDIISFTTGVEYEMTGKIVKIKSIK